jgi:hypothetical protein
MSCSQVYFMCVYGCLFCFAGHPTSYVFCILYLSASELWVLRMYSNLISGKSSCFILNPLNTELKSHLPFTSLIRRFNVYGSVHRKYSSIYVDIQQNAMLHSLFISGNCTTCLGWYFHPSSGAHTTVSTARGICHTVTAICRYRGRVGTSLSVLWVR